ncbi:unnamed protein product [Phytomonas sp. EM1]|nr:unnamed protein product [Phytomonas sp. EM1]|eukprot:CCW62734.1 unnamed protein product [Phytomonas sp. isolate EM1]
MSVYGISSYFLWTQKGLTELPLVRGSGFLMRYRELHTFYRYHVVTAGHVSSPVRYKQIYGDTAGLRAIGQRHLSTRLLVPSSETHKVVHSLEMEFKQYPMPNVDVALLRCKQEAHVEELGLQPIDVDKDPIAEGTELVFCGLDVEEERANPNDEGLLLRERRLFGVCKAALVSLDYGTVLLASLTDESPRAVDGILSKGLPLGMCGGPVLRRGSGKCVGVIVARVLKNAPPRDPNAGALYQDPYLDISENVSLHAHGSLDVAFVPIGEFYSSMRRSEL